MGMKEEKICIVRLKGLKEIMKEMRRKYKRMKKRRKKQRNLVERSVTEEVRSKGGRRKHDNS